MGLRQRAPLLFWLAGSLTLILVGFGIANLTGIGYPPGDDEWRTFVAVVSLVNAQFLLGGLLLVMRRARLGTSLLTIGALFAFITFAPVPLLFQFQALAVFILAIRHARQRSRAKRLSTA